MSNAAGAAAKCGDIAASQLPAGIAKPLGLQRIARDCAAARAGIGFAAALFLRDNRSSGHRSVAAAGGR